MKTSRRQLSVLLPAFLAASREAAAAGGVLPSKCYPFESLTVKTNAQTHNETRAVLDGELHTGVPLEVHITTLAPGAMPHPPHEHPHEEMIMVQQGTLEVTILDKSTKIGTGSVAFVHSNERHGWKNVGDTPAEYFVVAIGKQTS
jgi:quercetin dioxygenase-like cupin family protein